VRLGPAARLMLAASRVDHRPGACRCLRSAQRRSGVDGEGRPSMSSRFDAHWLGTNDVLSVYIHPRVPAVAAPIELTFSRRRHRDAGAGARAVRLWTGVVPGALPLDSWSLAGRREHRGGPPIGARPSRRVARERALGWVDAWRATLTIRDAHSLMHHISLTGAARPLHGRSTRPWRSTSIVFVLDSCVPPQCAWRGAGHPPRSSSTIRACGHPREPWHWRLARTACWFDPPGGPAVLTDTARLWGVPEPLVCHRR
jgi:hypothetical protein